MSKIRLTRKQALSVARDYSLEAGRPDGTMNASIVARLRHLFPGHKWRVILDRSGPYSRWAVSIDSPDKREHFVHVGGTCIHCGKTAKQLKIKERDE